MYIFQLVNFLRKSIFIVSILMTLNVTAQAKNWPQKPVKIVVAYPAGGLADVMARSVGLVLSENTGQPFIIENRAGANGNIAADYVAKSFADGYTLCLCSTVIESVNPFLYKNVSFNPEKDLTPVASTGKIQLFLITKPQMSVNNFNEFIEKARIGKPPLTYASAGSGSSPHLVGELFKKSAGFEATHVPYRGAAPAMTDLLGGAVDFFFDPGLSFQYVKEGRVKMLGVASAKRSQIFPEVPTLEELGYKNLDYDTWFGLYAPGKLESSIVKRINDEVNKALANVALKKRFLDLGAEAVAMSSVDFKAVAVREKSVFQNLIQKNNIRAD